MKYYDIKPLMATNSTYNMVMGKRSNGKTYAALNYAWQRYCKDGAQAAYVRRWDVDIRGKRGGGLLSGINSTNAIRKASKGRYTLLHYYNGAAYPANKDDKDKVIYEFASPFMTFYALNQWEHDKGSTNSLIKTIIFDEFITRGGGYIADEFVIFCNVVSTLIRGNDDVKIIMLGNTVSKYCPYFREMGLYRVDKQKQGSIDIYTYGDNRLQVAVEYAPDNTAADGGNNYYFAFDNPKLKMITSGEWQLPMYPRLKRGYSRDNVKYTYYILFSGRAYQCDIVGGGGEAYTFVFPKHGEIPLDKLVYSFDFSPSIWYNANIYKPRNAIEHKIKDFVIHGKMFYADNDTGNAIDNYLNQCGGAMYGR